MGRTFSGARTTGRLSVLVCVAAVLSVTLASPAAAQVRRAYAAIIGGATYTDLFGGGINSSHRWGGTAGLTAGFRTTRNTVVSIEGSWVQKGGGDVRVDYIEFPLLVGGNVAAGGGPLRFRGYAGLGFAFKVSCSSDVTFFANCDNVRSTEWSIPFGIMIGRWNPGGTVVVLDARYSLGLSDVFSTSFAYNRSWQFRLQIGRALGGRGGRSRRR